MDSKPEASWEGLDEDVPPPYSEEPRSPASTSTSPFAEEIHSHLISLTPTLASVCSPITPSPAPPASRRDDSLKDAHILSLIVPVITTYLSSFATSAATSGTLVLLPYLAIPEEEKAIPCIFDEPEKACLNQISEIRDVDTKGRAASLNEPRWWKDEVMAKRLSQALNPESQAIIRQEESIIPSSPVTEPELNQQPRPIQKGLWRKLSGGNQSALRRADRPSVATPRVPVVEERLARVTQHGIVMAITAEETLFRTENGLGIYGTAKGWCIILRLKVDRSPRSI